MVSTLMPRKGCQRTHYVPLRTHLASAARAWRASPQDCNLASRRRSTKSCDWPRLAYTPGVNLTRRSDGAIVALRGTIAKPLDQYKTHLKQRLLSGLLYRLPSDCLLGSKQAAINILLATLNRKDGHGGEEGGEATTKKKKKKEGVLLRPIICICNDL